MSLPLPSLPSLIALLLLRNNFSAGVNTRTSRTHLPSKKTHVI